MAHPTPTDDSLQIAPSYPNGLPMNHDDNRSPIHNSKILNVSQISGGFGGFAYGVIYRLDDGSHWRVIDRVFRIRPRMFADATVYHWNGRYYLSVPGGGGPVQIEPLKCHPLPPDDPLRPLRRAFRRSRQWFCRPRIVAALINGAARRFGRT